MFIVKKYKVRGIAMSIIKSLNMEDKNLNFNKNFLGAR